MKDDYRKTTNDRTVKYDSDPKNDYSDGYNAGRRYLPTETPKLWLLVLLLLALLLVLFALLTWLRPKNSNTNVQPTPTTQVSPTVSPTVSPMASPSSLPAVGGVEIILAN